MTTTTILLKPRRYAKYAGSFTLLPLLPEREAMKMIPSEIWATIFSFVAAGGRPSDVWSLVKVSKEFKATATRIAYQHIQIYTIRQLEQFYACLSTSDQKWDSLRRIPYSSPGRWVQSLELTELEFSAHDEAFALDSLLTLLFPLVPFLAHFSMNPTFIMSRRALSSLAKRPGAINLRSLQGITYIPSQFHDKEDSMIDLLRKCDNLAELELTGQTPVDPVDIEEWHEDSEALASSRPLHLPHLRILTVISIYQSPLLNALLNSELPSLKKVTTTPYDDVPGSRASQFLATHGSNLRSLLLFTPKAWPTRLHPSPFNILQTSPNLRHLSLEQPIPALVLSHPHPLQFLSIPRPSTDTWDLIVRLLPLLPNLCAIRVRDVRWLRKGMNSHAQEAGVQGTMREWRRRLARRGVRMLDADWKDIE